MKKLMIAAAIVCAAAMSQAAAINWGTSDVTKGVAVAGVTDNGDYNATGSNLKGNSALTYVLSLYDTESGELVGKGSGSVAFAGSKKVSTLINTGGGVAGTTYDYVLEITGTQTDLASKESTAYDYSAAKIASSQSGQLRLADNGTTTFGIASPTSWTVSGITAVPEPTSGLLLLLGVAGLALRRRRA